MLHRQSARLLFRVNSQKGTHQSVALFWIRRFLSIGSDKSVLHWSQWEGRGQHSTDQLMSSESKYPGGQCGEWPDVWCERPRPDSDLVWHCDTIHSHITQTPGIGQQWGGDPWCSCVLWQCSRPGQLSWASDLRLQRHSHVHHEEHYTCYMLHNSLWWPGAQISWAQLWLSIIRVIQSDIKLELSSHH